MEYGSTSRLDSMTPHEVQRGNQDWWTTNTMSYDWKEKIEEPRFTPAWFDEADERFIHSARLFATDVAPFDRIIPLAQLRGKRVLEIGCGMGLHTELMVRAGAHVTAVDLSPTSVAATRERLVQKGLTATVQGADAENLPFADGSFDFVWSWGVIHHSSSTSRIVREIARVLAPEGQVRVMVYNRAGINVALTYLTAHLLKGRFLSQSFEETLYATGDGFTARYYVADQFADLFRGFFHEVNVDVCGQDADAVPLPRQLRRIALKLVPQRWLQKQQQKRGAFLFLTATRPLRASAEA